MNAVLATLKERGFFKQCTDEDLLNRKLEEGPVRIYVGVDPYRAVHAHRSYHPSVCHASSAAGRAPTHHTGGGWYGSYRRSFWKKLICVRCSQYDQIKDNAERLKKQIAQFISFEDGTSKLVDNADWLAPLNYIDFLRDIGRHFLCEPNAHLRSLQKTAGEGSFFY